jgi:hypothetical protein
MSGHIHCIEVQSSTGSTFGSGEDTVVLRNYWHSHRLATGVCDLMRQHSDEYNRKHRYYIVRGKEIDPRTPYSMTADDFNIMLPMYSIDNEKVIWGKYFAPYNGYFENLLSVDIRTFSSRGEALSHYRFGSRDAESFISVKTLQPDTYLGDIPIDSEW